MGAGVEASDWLKPRLTTYNYTRTFLDYSVLDQTFWWKDRPDNDRDGGGGAAAPSYWSNPRPTLNISALLGPD
jgi:hypothetical protein